MKKISKQVYTAEFRSQAVLHAQDVGLGKAARGHGIGLARVERLMSTHGIRARHKRRFKATTDSKHTLPVAQNVLDRKFTQQAPNQV